MSGFIDINRLDYIDQAQICMREEFAELRQLQMYCRCRTAEFLLCDNWRKLSNLGGRSSFAAIRVRYKDIWEWHIPGAVKRMIRETVGKLFLSGDGGWDCLWMLKSENGHPIPAFFCDAVLFRRGGGDEDLAGRWLDLVDGYPHIAGTEVLAESGEKGDYGKSIAELRFLCRPDSGWQLLHSEFAGNILVTPDMRCIYR